MEQPDDILTEFDDESKMLPSSDSLLVSRDGTPRVSTASGGSNTGLQRSDEQQTKHTSTVGRRQCWVCLALEEDDRETSWTSPCKCRGATKWVHQHCIQRWIDEKQGGTPSTTVVCPQCNTDYVIAYPKYSCFVYILDRIDRGVLRVSPYLAAGVVMGSIYWSAVTFGAVSVLQVLGYRDGLKYIESADPFFLLVGLPTIPTGLLLVKMIPWEECLLRIWLQRAAGLMQFLGRLTNLSTSGHVTRTGFQEHLMTTPGFSHTMNATRLFCSALLLPTIATLIGRLLFPNIRSGVHRAFLGAIILSIVKGFLKIYLRREQFIRQAKRKVLDYDVTLSTSSASSIPQTVWYRWCTVHIFWLCVLIDCMDNARNRMLNRVTLLT